MTESQSASTFGTWNVPQCPFAVEYSLRAMDDIRLAVIDAFFSLPRGGAEIGGVLLGRIAQGRVIISDYLALDCEHAFGPSFTLSAPDEARLKELLQIAPKAGGGVPVGWYHSHTRSEIFLSDADLAIHKRFFPEPWQVALVLKPHTFQPVRCGFFFREANGNIQATSTYREFALDTLPVHPIPSGDVPQSAGEGYPPRAQMEGAAQTINVIASAAEATAVPEAPVVPPPVEEREEDDQKLEPIEPPQVQPTPPRRSWLWLKAALALAVGVAIGVAGFQTRQLWWPKVTGPFTPSGPSPPAFAPVGLSTIDTDGQLQIHWDHDSSSVRQATGATLSINDSSGSPYETRLDAPHLQNGNFTYARKGESVTVMLTLDEPHGKQVHEVSTFLGQPLKPQAPVESPEIEKQRGTVLQESAHLRQQLAAEVERNRKLQKALDTARAQLREQIRKRMGNQSPDRGK